MHEKALAFTVVFCQQRMPKVGPPVMKFTRNRIHMVDLTTNCLLTLLDQGIRITKNRELKQSSLEAAKYV